VATEEAEAFWCAGREGSASQCVKRDTGVWETPLPPLPLPLLPAVFVENEECACVATVQCPSVMAEPTSAFVLGAGEEVGKKKKK
jgi:hypothetical protein